MKNLAFLFVAVVAFSACGNKSANTTATEENTVEVVETATVVEATDSTATDSTACCGGEHHKAEETPTAE